jgi:hypothetical protein
VFVFSPFSFFVFVCSCLHWVAGPRLHVCTVSWLAAAQWKKRNHDDSWAGWKMDWGWQISSFSLSLGPIRKCLA